MARLVVFVLSLAGVGLASYLGLYQLGIVHEVWEPFFGEGSRRILKESGIAHMLPIPDAFLGALAYLTEALLGLPGGRDRYRTRPWLVLLLGLNAAGLALGGILLTCCQAFVYRAFCTLCLTSAGCSLLVFAFALPEVRAAYRTRWPSRTRATP